jgi:DNA-binding NtrC family response regulator
MSARVLIVDPESNLLFLLRHGLRRYGFSNHESAPTAGEAVKVYRERPAEVVLFNRAVPDLPLAEFVGRCRAVDPHAAVIVYTWESRFPEALSLVREQGVTDCVRLCPECLEDLPLAIERALVWRRMSQRCVRLRGSP